MSRIFLTLHPFYEDGAIFGRKQANRGFMNALFRKNPFDLYHFYVDNPQQLTQTWQEVPEAQALLAQGALHAFPRTQLEKRLKIIPYTVCHFSDPVTEFSAMCHVRNALAPKIFPITAVNHTISYIEYAQSTLGHIWQGTSPRDGIGCTSHASRSIMQAWYAHARKTRAIPDHWQEPHLNVIPLGVPDPELGNNPNMRESLRKELKLAPETVLILLYGRISIVDKMDVRPFFAALRRIRAKYPQLPFFFYIAGTLDDPQIEEQYTDLAKAWDIPFAISPHPSRTLKKQLFAAADVFVSPTDNIQETFGLTLVEAAQSALPVIASNWDGYKDIVIHEETGLLIPTLAPSHTPMLDTMASVYFNKIHQLFRSQQTVIYIPQLEHALYRLLSDKDLRQKMGQKAKERAAKIYTFDHVVEEWINFWQKLETTPISAEQEAQLRTAKHPYSLAFGQAFACYTSHNLHNESVLCCTELGLACLHKQEMWNNYGLTAVNLVDSLIYALLKECTKSVSMEKLLHTAQNSPWGKKFSEEVLMAHIHWLLKQDLVEYNL